MIQIVCDNCEGTFEVDPAEAGGKVPCPTCGDVNRIPADDEPAAPPEPAAEMPVGDAGDGVEREIMVVRPGMFRAHPFRYALIVTLAIAGIVGAIFFAVAERVGGWSWFWVPSLLVSLVSLAWFAQWWMSTHWWIKLVITNKRSVRHEGIVKRHTTEVLHNHVRSVDIQQSFLERLFGIGTIGIDSAGQDGIEINIIDIPKPYHVKEIIDRYRRM